MITLHRVDSLRDIKLSKSKRDKCIATGLQTLHDKLKEKTGTKGTSNLVVVNGYDCEVACYLGMGCHGILETPLNLFKYKDKYRAEDNSVYFRGDGYYRELYPGAIVSAVQNRYPKYKENFDRFVDWLFNKRTSPWFWFLETQPPIRIKAPNARHKVLINTPRFVKKYGMFVIYNMDVPPNAIANFCQASRSMWEKWMRSRVVWAFGMQDGYRVSFDLAYYYSRFLKSVIPVNNYYQLNSMYYEHSPFPTGNMHILGDEYVPYRFYNKRPYLPRLQGSYASSYKWKIPTARAVGVWSELLSSSENNIQDMRDILFNANKIRRTKDTGQWHNVVTEHVHKDDLVWFLKRQEKKAKEWLKDNPPVPLKQQST